MCSPKISRKCRKNLSGLLSALSLQKADICLLQEVDLDSNRSYWINEADHFARGLSMGWTFAYNFRCGSLCPSRSRPLARWKAVC